jgi:hypothetical protein
VELQITVSSAHFADGSKTTRPVGHDDGTLELPALSGVVSDETVVIAVKAGGRSLGELRVRRIPKARWDQMLSTLKTTPDALVESGDGFLIVDETAVLDDGRGVMSQLSTDGQDLVGPVNKGLCVRSPLGPGRVKLFGHTCSCVNSADIGWPATCPL